ncbi:MAG: ABC transporter ATP-binding protein [Elusimicrobiaceae bacterium]|nr:ABC transporter ATP-binding protein [Elusimicrobiaceae bacterium]
MVVSPVLQVCDLQVSFMMQKRAYPVLRELSYNLLPGRILAVVGESGSGKTVHALSLLGLLPPAAHVSRGKILYRDTDLLTMPRARLRDVRGSKISMIFQDPSASLNPVLTVGEQLIETLRAHKPMSKQQAREEAVRLLEKVGIADAPARLSAYPFEFSGGMCQRVMIAMALALSPDILIADEPTTALDVTIQAQILHLIRELQQKEKMAVIFITHNLALASEIADEVLVLYGGLCMEQAPAKDLFEDPHHPYTKGLLASLVSMDRRVERLPAIAGQPPMAGEITKGCPFASRCPQAQEKCRQQLPPLTQQGIRMVRCFEEKTL